MKHFEKIMEIVYPELNRQARIDLKEFHESKERHRIVDYLVGYVIANNSRFKQIDHWNVYLELLRFLTPLLSGQDFVLLIETRKRHGILAGIKTAHEFYYKETDQSIYI